MTSVKDQIKQAQERTHQFMTAMAGNLSNFEEALRALYAKDKKKLNDQMLNWPKDIKNYVNQMSAAVFDAKELT